MARRTLADAETQVARLVMSEGHWKRDARRAGRRADGLERAIRTHAEGTCDCPNDRTCLMRLYRLVPVRERRRHGKT